MGFSQKDAIGVNNLIATISSKVVSVAIIAASCNHLQASYNQLQASYNQLQASNNQLQSLQLLRLKLHSKNESSIRNSKTNFLLFNSIFEDVNSKSMF